MDNDCVLLSAIGHTDPVSHRHDGAILHICRHYKPSKVYLLYSSEMCAIHDGDDRFEFAIDDLNERCGLDIKCEHILKPDLVDVQRFDKIADLMKTEVDRIHNENPDKQVLLNVSSGTPAMKGALILLANLLPDSYHVKAIQVSAPEKTVRDKEEQNKNAAQKICDEIRDNEDFCENAVDRSYAEVTSNIFSEIVKKDVCAHIDAYDYSAALRQLGEIKSHGGKISDRVQILLEAADQRLNAADKSMLRQALTDEENSMVFAKMQDNLSNLAEYGLWLQIKLKSHHQTDFIRGITPICYELPIQYLRCVRDKNISALKVTTKRGDFFDESKSGYPLYKECMDILDKKFREGYDNKKMSWCSETLIELVRGMNSDAADVADFEELRRYEQEVRNKIAHTIPKNNKLLRNTDQKLADKWERLSRLLKRTLSLEGAEFRKYLNSYDTMNSIIKAEVIRAV